MKYLTVIIICISFFSPYKQLPEFTYMPVPGKYVQIINNGNGVRKNFLDSLKNPYRLEKSLPSNFVKDGSADYTDYLQAGIKTHQDIIFPDFPVLIDTNGLKFKSNTKIYFPENSRILLQPNNLQGYQILSIKNAQNIHLYFPNIIGDREKHISDRGNWGFGISILGSSNIIIEHPTVTLCWGDGIYIGSTTTPSKNITISNAFVDNNRRNGISITSGVNIKIDSSVFSNSNGKAPRSGIHLEPNNNADEINYIDILNCVTFNNEQSGLMINLVKLKQGDNLKDVNINVVNHIDDNSNYGMGLWLTTKKRIGKGLIGNINVTNSKWLNNKTEAYRYFENDINNVAVAFKNIKIYNKNAPQNMDLLQLQSLKNKYQNNSRIKFSN